MPRALRLGALLAAALLVASPSLAQSSRTPVRPPAEPAPPPPPPEPPPAPYEGELLRLAEILGALAFLRSLCQAPDAGEYPRRMQALVEAEGTTPGRRDRLVGAYNRGFRGFATTYRLCTDSAAEAIARYLREGEALSRNLAGRFGG
jgi:uncharacterized protein (TIGR02301 family)